MQVIQHQELGSSQASITFSSISQGFTDLYLVYSLRTTGNDDYWGLALNGSTSNFSLRSLFGTGSGVTSDSRSDGLVGNTANPNNYTASTFSNGALYIPNYKSSTAKSLSNDAVTENNATEAKQRITAMLWNVTDPINSITLNAPPTLSFVQYSSATLYGVLAGTDGIVVVS
jgi:hypothetical protein